MKVFLYGSNCASIINSLAVGLKSKGVEVKGLSYFESKYVNYDQLELLESGVSGRFKRLASSIRNNWKILKAMLWCDVVHVFWDANAFVVLAARLLGKRRLLTFCGSEVRRPTIALEYNPYYKLAYHNPAYEYRYLENDATSMVRQRRFGNAGFGFIVYELPMYLDRSICKEVHVIPHASVNTITAKPSVPDGKIRIVHAPSAPIAKGSIYVVKAMESLRARYPDLIETQLVMGVTNQQYQQMLMDADILVDQVIWGSYGVASQQAMLLGKTVVCYINDFVKEQAYHPDLPIQSATVDNLESVLEDLVLNEQKRKEIGERCRDFYERFHTPDVVAGQVLQVYQKQL